MFSDLGERSICVCVCVHFNTVTLTAPLNPSIPKGFSEWNCACVLSLLSHAHLFVTLWTVACQAPLSMGILQARKNTGEGCCALQGNLPDAGIKCVSLTFPD